MRTDLPSGDGVNSNHFDGGGSIGDSGGIVQWWSRVESW